MKKSYAMVLACGCVAVAGVGSARAAEYTLSNLGIPEPSPTDVQTSSSAGGINAGGQVAYTAPGTTAVSNGGYAQPYVYTPTGPTTGTSTQLPTLGGRTAVAGGVNCINNAGQVVGFSRIAGTDPTAANPFHAALWNKTPSGYAVTDLGTIGGENSYGQSINSSGQVTGYSDTASGDSHAFKYANGTMIDLGVTAGTVGSSGQGINAAGVVAGSIINADGTYSAAYWDATNTVHEIPKIGGSYSAGYFVTDGGVIGGFSTIDDANVDSNAILYDTNTSKLTDLGHLSATFDNASAYGMNAAGVVVGGAYTPDNSDSRAFLYRNGTMIDLNTLVDAPGWTLNVAASINDAGQIVGYGLDPNGFYHVYELTLTSAVPEPASLGLLVVPAVLALRRRRSSGTRH